MNLKRLWASRQGYTIDQTILIVAIIAILITLIIITIGWTLLTRATGNKLGSYFTQFETALSSFYDTNKRFPNDIAELQNAGLIKFRTDGSTFYHDISGADGQVIYHNRAYLENPSLPIAYYSVVEYTAVQPAEAIQANTSADNDDPSAYLGRVYFSPGPCVIPAGVGTVINPTNTPVSVCHIVARVS